MEEYGSLEVVWAQGYKGDEIFHVDSDSICYACGNCLKFMDVTNSTESTFHNVGNGIKKIATLPSQSLFAVAELGLNPRIFIYRYPSSETVNTLEGGAELEYTSLAFSYSGSLIAACSSLPDFTLFVWNWSTGELKCKEKLLSEDLITSLLFNPLNQHQISLIGPSKVTLWTLQECNDVSTLRSRKINIPTTDGVLLREDEDALSRSPTRAGYLITVPASAKAGLYGEAVRNFQPPDFRRPRLTPVSQCWSSRGEVFIGCTEGSLFRVEAESDSVTVMLGSTSDRIIKGEVESGMFQSIAFNAQGILAGGTDNYLRQLTIDNNGIKIDKVWKCSHPIATVSFSPKNFQTLIYGTNAGSIHQFSTADYRGDLISMLHAGQFVGISFGDGGRVCTTCREDGELQVWESETGFLLSSLSLNMRVTSVAFCPSSPVIAVGTWSGHICYVDASVALHDDEEGDMRQVYTIRMHHGPVSFLQYDGLGNYLLSACNEESQIFVINAKPSADFACIGYVDCMSSVKNLSIQQQGKIVNVTAVIAPHEQTHPDSPSDGVVVFSLSPEILSDPKEHFQSRRRNFKDKSVKCRRFQLSAPVDSAIVTLMGDCAEVAALSVKNKKLLKFILPMQQKSSDSEEPTPLACSPVSEHPAHQLDGGIMEISPHGKWLASSSKDGSIIVRDLQNWDSCISILGHAYMEGGVKAIAFSPDAKQIVSVGANDASFTCYSWNFTDKGSIAAIAGVEFARVRNMQLRSTIEPECEALYALEEIIATPMENRSASAATIVPEEETATAQATQPQTPDTLQQQRPMSSAESEIPMTPTPVPLSDATWLDHRMVVAIKEENAKYDEVKRDLRTKIKDLRKMILGMMENNATLPELEQLRHDEFNLDAEEQKRMQAEQDKQVQSVREEINLENLAQRYLAYLIKKECWDDMVAKGRSLKTFNLNVIVNNYPTKAVSAQEEALLKKITQMRTIEIAENSVRKTVVEAVASKTSVNADEEEEEEEDKVVGLALHGSLGPKYNGDSDLFYSQFDLHTREEKMAQLVLLKDALRRIKESFNDSFSNVYRNKEQELARIKERNVRIRAIMKDLDMDSSAVVDPQMDQDEMPEKAFVVSDEEVTVERVLSEEQQKEKEEQEKIEEERRAAAKGDNKRERALLDMMGGVLEVKKEDLLKQDLPPPDFAEEKLEKDWTDEERKKYKEYEKRMKDLQEEREKYRKNLENELKKLQSINLEGMAAFDETLTHLFNKKVKTEMVINQEELKLLRLTASIMMNDNLSTHEKHLNYLFDLKSKLQVASSKVEIEIRKKVEDFREVYDSVVAEDKMLDRGFKREFSDVPLSISDQLYKLFRRRPRIQRHRNVEEKSASLDPYGIFDKSSAAPAHSHDSEATLAALAELDNEAHMPEGVDAHLWERLCDARRTKVENELRVKHTAMTLAEMTQYMQNRQEENDRLAREIDDVARQQAKLCDDSMKNTLNLEIQLLLKQGQVEVPCGQYIPEYSDSILVHRGVVEDLNGTIRTLGESKVAAMTESKDFKKGIHQLEWERKRMIMQMEDLHNRARHIQMLKLTKELQAFLNEENQSAKQAKQMAVLEQTLALQDKQLDKNISQKDAITSQLIRKVRMKEHENKELDKVLEELHVSVSERQNIVDVNALERTKNTADKRLHGIVQRRKLVDLAKAQAQEVAVLRAEVERLRMKTFPALVQVER